MYMHVPISNASFVSLAIFKELIKNQCFSLPITCAKVCCVFDLMCVLAVNARTVLAIVPPQGCEAILVEILQSKRYCLLVKTPSRS